MLKSSATHASRAMVVRPVRGLRAIKFEWETLCGIWSKRLFLGLFIPLIFWTLGEAAEAWTQSCSAG